MTKRIPDPWIDGLYGDRPKRTRRKRSAGIDGEPFKYDPNESYCVVDRDGDLWVYIDGVGWYLLRVHRTEYPWPSPGDYSPEDRRVPFEAWETYIEASYGVTEKKMRYRNA